MGRRFGAGENTMKRLFLVLLLIVPAIAHADTGMVVAHGRFSASTVTTIKIGNTYYEVLSGRELNGLPLGTQLETHIDGRKLVVVVEGKSHKRLIAASWLGDGK
jgi:hypothetical protein